MEAKPTSLLQHEMLADVSCGSDFVAKVFLASGRETLIQNLARARNVDSRTHSPRFDYFKFQFYRAGSETFATKSVQMRTHASQQEAILFDHLVGEGNQPVGHRHP
jgi:hypothetical protein